MLVGKILETLVMNEGFNSLSVSASAKAMASSFPEAVALSKAIDKDVPALSNLAHSPSP